MKHLEKRLIIEADADEVNELTQKMEQTFADIIIQFRHSCQLSKYEAATMANVDRKTLTAHENGCDMYLSTLCHDIAAYLLYMKENKIEGNEELHKLIAFLWELLTKL